MKLKGAPWLKCGVCAFVLSAAPVKTMGFGVSGKAESDSAANNNSVATSAVIVAPHPVVAEAVLEDLADNEGYIDVPLRADSDAAIKVADLPEEVAETMPEGFGSVSFEDIFDVNYDGADGYPSDVEYVENPEKSAGDTASDMGEEPQEVYPARAGHLYHAGRYFTAWYYPELVESFGKDARIKSGKASTRSARGFSGKDDPERYKFASIAVQTGGKGDGIDTVGGSLERGHRRNAEGSALQAVYEIVDSNAVKSYIDGDTDLDDLCDLIREKREEVEPWSRETDEE